MFQLQKMKMMKMLHLLDWIGQMVGLPDHDGMIVGFTLI